jgi:lipopolysaccharide/colanic/teichoic acid biosynthesis glycosyltransferase
LRAEIRRHEPALAQTGAEFEVTRNEFPEDRATIEMSSDWLQTFLSDLSIRYCSVSGGTVVKRAVDVIVSAALLLIVLPVLVLAALMILATSPGPVLFRQTRMGRGFQPFKILKLRTMAHAEAGLAYTLGPDPRITPVGRWLRRTKVDELPQLWNVLRGEMSLVGPRPVLPELTREFHEYYSLLLKARPGLTDPASLKYSQENLLLAKAEDPMRFFKAVVTPDKIRISFDYMERASFWTDCFTLAMTALICSFPSLSRFYGDLPSVASASHMGRPEGNFVEGTTRLPVDESVFSHELAFLEATVEEVPQRDPLPWIPLQDQNIKSRSSPSGTQESASRL